ncbi:MAG: hypothetical protein F6K24_38985 [Okeania sp. SIO2D1]|nr:hypothetical protein [Okeania sp. SIO2D1]
MYPIDDRFGGRVNQPRPTVWEDRTKFTFYPGAVFLPGDIAPNIGENNGYIITADLNITEPRQVKGVILASGGGDTGGYSLYVNKNQKLVFEYKYLNRKRTKIRSKEKLKNGLNQVSFSFKFDDEGPIQSKINLKPTGSGDLCVNGKQVASGDIPAILDGNFMMDSQDVGMDMRFPVSKHYEPPFEFTGGEIKNVTINIDPSKYEYALASAQYCGGLETAPYEEEFTSSEQTTSVDKLSHGELTDRIIQEIVERLEK